MEHTYYSDQIAVVTGAASGLGLGMSERLLAYGVRMVWMTDYNEETLLREAARLAQIFPGRVRTKRVDVSSREEVFAAIDGVVAAEGRIDLLFNNAGKPFTNPTEETSPDIFASLTQINYLGAVWGTLAALPHMLEQGTGHVVNTASIGGLFPIPYQAAYASSKAALITFTHSLYYEYADRGIVFTQVSPANVATPIFSVQEADRLRAAGMSEDEVQRRIVAVKPPQDALPLAAALDRIFEGVTARQRDVIVGDEARKVYERFWGAVPQADALLMQIAQTRRDYYDECRRIRETPGCTDPMPPFPG